MTTTPPRALITGITGQDGSYLAELLLSKGYEVWGAMRRTSSTNLQRIAHLVSRKQGGTADEGPIQLVHADMADANSLLAALETSRPHEIYALASQSHVQVSFELPEFTANVTGLGTLRLLQAIRDLGLSSRFFQAGSSEQFGKVTTTPQNELTPFHPCSPYACAKVFAHNVTRNYRESYGIFASNGILFNHESPRRGETFVTRKITRGIAAILRGKAECIQLGNLHARRDWGFAGDYVEAMWRVLQANQPDDFVISTGETHSVREFCDLAFAHAGMPLTWHGAGLHEHATTLSGQTVIRVDPHHFRPAEVDLLIGDSSKARRILNWEPKTSFKELVAMMIEADLHDPSLEVHAEVAEAKSEA